MSQQPEERAPLDAFVQRQVADAVRRRSDRRAAHSAVRASALASDLDRDTTAEVLNQAFADGRLTPEEHADRTTRAFTARTHGELQQVLTGLHLPPPPMQYSRVRSALFWLVAIPTLPLVLLGVLMLFFGDDLGTRVFGIVFIVLFAPGIFALHRWAHPRPTETFWPQHR